MLKLVLTFVIGGALGVAAGFATGIFVYPYIFLSAVVAAEIVDTAARKPVAAGRFVHANPSDPIHWGKGGVSVYPDLVHLEADFEVGPGPKFHVYLVPDAAVTTATRVDKTRYVDLGRLKAFKGSQSYAVPPGVDPAAYGSVVIWCERFGVLISPARLQRLDQSSASMSGAIAAGSVFGA
ncbi:MAG TPA: DM13 domain-containing protein [Burkholderiaceae bacterium]|jgi:hypothetical protein|nr:DM13 domain-containing protein [Burkholderiaceae bacterium]